MLGGHDAIASDDHRTGLRPTFRVAQSDLGRNEGREQQELGSHTNVIQRNLMQTGNELRRATRSVLTFFATLSGEGAG